MVRSAHLSTVFADLVAKFGDRTALVDQEGKLTYREFFATGFRFGNGLVAHGLKRGERIALLLSDSRHYLIADYGMMGGGFVRVPLDPRLSDLEMLAQLELSDAVAVVTEQVFAQRIALIREKLPQIEIILADGKDDEAVSMADVIAAGSAEPASGLGATDLAALNFSGGSTGRPKATMIRHHCLATVLDTVPEGFGIAGSDVFLNIRPLWPIAQVVMMGYFAAGATVVLGGRFDPATFADTILACGATRTSLVPTQLNRVLDHVAKDDQRLEKLTAIHVGGSRIPPATFARALELLGPRIGVLYGLTEAPVTTYLSPDDFVAAGSIEAMHALMGGSGRVLGDYEIRLGEGGGEPEGDLGASGEVLIRGGHVMAGYWKEPDLSEAALADGWLHTNDLGAFDGNGRLYIVGRLKDVIRSGASSILPKEVEDAISGQDAILDVAVVGLPDEEWGEIVAAFVVARAGQTVEPASVIANCDARLARFKRPKRVFVIDEIPRSHYGKVLKPKLLDKMREAEVTETR